VSDNRPNIWRLQALADVPGLIKALEYGDPDVRQRAAVALRALEAFEAIPAMRAALTKEDDPDARTLITSALVHLLEEQQEQAETTPAASPPDELTLLVEQLKSKDTNEIIHAAQALGALGDTLAVEPLVVLFNNMQMPANVRLAAAEALIELKSPPTVVTALVALRRPGSHLRRIAAAMLGHLEADWAVAPLAEVLHDENELVWRTARAALKHIGTPEALAALEAVPEPETALPTIATTPVHAVPSTAVTAEKAADSTPASPTPEPESSSPTPARAEKPAEVASPSAEMKADDHSQAAATQLHEQAASASEGKPPETAPPSPQPAPKATTLVHETPRVVDETPAEAVSGDKPAETAQPDWSQEKTRPTRPALLDAALNARTSSPPAADAAVPSSNAEGESDPTPPAASPVPTVSSDGAAPESQNPQQSQS
jgi:hypothetical protein